MKEAYVPELFDKNLLDKKINIDDEDAFEMTRRLAKEEGLFVGMSSGAAMAVAVKESEAMDKGTIVVIFPDSGERYLSTDLFTVREKAPLKLFNTMTRIKEPFEPIRTGKVGMYSCGPTAHARIHIGECRRFIFSDLLAGYLEFRGYEVKHIMNITDLDDKTIEGSEKEGIAIDDFTTNHINAFKKDLTALSITHAAEFPKASQHVDDMVDLARKLVTKGYAYEKLRSLYFDISHFQNYGKLSNVDINKIRLGATVDLDEYEKDNPRDFTLFKRAKLSELKRGIYTKTDWGNVRPSWHIQCAAISMKYLGESFDIHTSSRELIFPHHENEIAISTAASGKPLARYWIHCERVLVDGKKVDEKGTGPTIDNLISNGYTNREIRFWLLSTHYRKALVLSDERLLNARLSLKRIDSCIQRLQGIDNDLPCPDPYPDLDQIIYNIKNGFVTAMDDDLNISAALASLFKSIKQVNLHIKNKQIDQKGAQKILVAFREINTVLKVFEFKDMSSNPEVKRLLKERESARKEKKWGIADSIRDQLEAMGVSIHDTKFKEE
jgi:cysteinyl-tRNA synthetase